jgi:hypothetical protein
MNPLPGKLSGRGCACRERNKILEEISGFWEVGRMWEGRITGDWG